MKITRSLKTLVRWVLSSFGIQIKRVPRVPISTRLAKVEAALNKIADLPAIAPANNVVTSKNIEVAEIRSSLLKLGIQKGDRLLIHSSIKAFIREKNSDAEMTNRFCSNLIEMLSEIVGSEGCIAMPTDFLGDYLIADGKKIIFDLNQSKSNRGYLTEYFRNLKGVKRSTNPIYNISILGSGFEESLARHSEFEYVMDAGTPWWQFMQNSGKIIFLGTGLDCNSMIHVPEYFQKQLYPRPVFFGRPHSFQIKSFNGSISEIKAYLHAIRWSPGTVTRFCNYLNAKYEIYRSYEIDGTVITVVSALDQYNALMKELEKGISWYDAEYFPDKFDVNN